MEDADTTDAAATADRQETADGADPWVADDEGAGRTRGRPLAADRTDAILDAASELFDEVGYDHLRVQDIADRAGVGLATLYRRWPTKQALLAETMRRRNAAFSGVGEGPPLEILGRVFSMLAQTTLGPRGEFLPGLLTAIRDDDDLAEGLRVGIIEPLRARIRAELAAELGADHPQLDLLVDLVPGVCVYRALAPIDPGSPESLVDSSLALISALAAARPEAADPPV